MRSLLGLALLLKTASAAITGGDWVQTFGEAEMKVQSAEWHVSKWPPMEDYEQSRASNRSAGEHGRRLQQATAHCGCYGSGWGWVAVASGCYYCSNCNSGCADCASGDMTCTYSNDCHSGPRGCNCGGNPRASCPPPSPSSASSASSASSDNTFLYVVIAVLCVALLGGGGYLVARTKPKLSSANSPVGLASQQVELQSTTSGGGYDMRPIEGLPLPPTATATHVSPAPKFDPNTGEPIVPASPDPFANARRFDDNTGEPIPKFNPNTGERNW